MSHIVKGKSTLNDESLVRAACRRLKLDEPVRGRHHLYSGTVEGLGVRLPDWNYPLVINTDSGDLTYDNYGGSWGSPAEIDRFNQAYGIEKHRATAAAHQFAVQEAVQDDGTVRLEVLVEA